MSRFSSFLSASIIERLPLVVVAFATLMLFSMSYLAIDSSVKLVRESLVSKSVVAFISTNNKLSSELSSLASLIRNESSSPIVRNALADSEGLQSYLRPHLESLIQGYDALMSIALIDGVGNPVVTASKPGTGTAATSISQTELIEFIERGEPAYILETQSSLKLIWPVFFPPTGKHEGILLARIDLGRITGLAAKSITDSGDSKVTINLVKPEIGALSSPHQQDNPVIPGNEFSLSRRFDLPPPFLLHQAQIEYHRSSAKERNSVIQTIWIHAFSTALAWLVFFILAKWIKLRYVEPIRKITAIAASFSNDSRNSGNAEENSAVERLQQSVESVINVLNATEHSYQKKIRFTAQELRQTRARLKDIARSGNIIAMSVDLPTGVISYSTESLTRFLRKVRNPQHHKNAESWKELYRLVLKDDRPALKTGIKRCLRFGFSRIPVRVQINEKNLVFDLRLQRAVVVHGRNERIDCLAFDNTDIAEKELALAQSESRKAAIINAALDGFVALSPDFLIMEVNPAAENILGRKNITLLGMRFADHCIAPASVKQFLNFCSQLVKSKEGNLRHQGELIWCRDNKDRNIPVEISGSLINMPTGRQICLYIKDLSNTFEQQREISEKNTEIRAIFELSPGGFASFNHKGLLSAHNHVLQDMLNLDSDFFSRKITQLAFDELIKQLMISTPQKNLEKLVHPGEKILRISGPKEKLLKCAKRQSHPAMDTGSCVYYFTDITQEFQLDNLKSNFLATAAHELRTPLTTILGFSELMSTQDLTPDVRKELMTSIFRHSLQLNALLNDLLDLSKIESEGANLFKPKCVDLATLLSDLVMKSSIQRDKHRFIQDHKISLEIPPGASFKIVADEEKLLRAFQNVISNAAKYSGPESPIAITAREERKNEKSLIKVSVTDQGIGMTPEETEHAFLRFWRADSSSGKIPGTGLGLPLVKEIIELHQGHVEIDSKYGKGTTVSIYLPADQQQAFVTQESV